MKDRSMSTTRDRELADMLYGSYTKLRQLQADLRVLSGMQPMSTELAVVAADKAQDHDMTPHTPHPVSAETKALADALDIVTHVNHRIEQVVKLLVSHHTDASSIINEFEKIRTGELLNSQTFALAHIIKSETK
jgi:hypothetical protein